MLSSLIKEKIKTHALNVAPNECCGFVFENDTLECRNSSEDPTRHFSIPPQEYLKASRKGNFNAVYHSHPNGEAKFSQYDKQVSQNMDINFVMYHNPSDKFFIYEPSKEKTSHISERFSLGRSDCYILVIDYYKNLGISLLDIEGSRNNENWFKKNPSLIKQIFDLNASNSKSLLQHLEPDSKLKKHDVLVFKMIDNPEPSHVGVYLGEEMFLHHPRNKFPSTQKLTPALKKRVCKIYRNPDLNE
mgnify:CR=1 FL=1|tara:strand:+ start:142 stop:876 length:735 start_codon:yes stop_codon:yes gene_type:complete